LQRTEPKWLRMHTAFLSPLFCHLLHTAIPTQISSHLLHTTYTLKPDCLIPGLPYTRTAFKF